MIKKISTFFRFVFMTENDDPNCSLKAVINITTGNRTLATKIFHRLGTKYTAYHHIMHVTISWFIIITLGGTPILCIWVGLWKVYTYQLDVFYGNKVILAFYYTHCIQWLVLSRHFSFHCLWPDKSILRPKLSSACRIHRIFKKLGVIGINFRFK